MAQICRFSLGDAVYDLNALLHLISEVCHSDGITTIQWTFKQELDYHAGCGQPVSSGIAEWTNSSTVRIKRLQHSLLPPLFPQGSLGDHQSTAGVTPPVLGFQEASFCTLRTTPVYMKITDSQLSQEAVLGDHSRVLWAFLLWGQLLILGNYAP